MLTQKKRSNKKLVILTNVKSSAEISPIRRLLSQYRHHRSDGHQGFIYVWVRLFSQPPDSSRLCFTKRTKWQTTSQSVSRTNQTAKPKSRKVKINTKVPQKNVCNKIQTSANERTTYEQMNGWMNGLKRFPMNPKMQNKSHTMTTA